RSLGPWRLTLRFTTRSGATPPAGRGRPAPPASRLRTKPPAPCRVLPGRPVLLLGPAVHPAHTAKPVAAGGQGPVGNRLAGARHGAQGRTGPGGEILRQLAERRPSHPRAKWNPSGNIPPTRGSGFLASKARSAGFVHGTAACHVAPRLRRISSISASP